MTTTRHIVFLGKFAYEAAPVNGRRACADRGPLMNVALTEGALEEDVYRVGLRWN